MNVAALIAWLITALGGFYLLGKWLARGGIRQQQAGTSRFPAPVIFAFVILLPVALLGFTMFFRWIGVYRGTALAPAGSPAPAAAGRPASAGVPAERHLPVPVVLAHGALAATTIVLVLLAALGA